MARISSEYPRDTKQVRYVISEKFQGAIDNFSGPKSNIIIHQGLKLKFIFIKRVRSLTGSGQVCFKTQKPTLPFSLSPLSYIQPIAAACCCCCATTRALVPACRHSSSVASPAPTAGHAANHHHKGEREKYMREGGR